MLICIIMSKWKISFVLFFLIKTIKHVEIKDQAFQLICMFKLQIKKIIIIYINVVA